MQISNQAIVNYQGTWPIPQFSTAADVFSRVLADLGKAGFIVTSSANDASIAQNLPPYGLSKAPFDVTLTLQVNNGLGFGSEDDIISIVRHWVFQEAGDFPSADAVPFIQQAGSNQSITTGQPQNPDAPGITAGPGSSFFGNFWNGIKSFFSSTTIAVAGIGIGIVVAIVMIGEGKRR